MRVNREHIIAARSLVFDKPADREMHGFLFHTGAMPDPYVVFDLGEVASVNSIRITNRTGSEELKERARELTVHVSHDLLHWLECLVIFDEDMNTAQAEVNANLRFLRFSLPRFGILHVNAIDVVLGQPRAEGIVKGEYGYWDGAIYLHTHNEGFFSVCSTALLELARRHPITARVDASKAFDAFKDDPGLDCWSCFFAQPNGTPPTLKPAFFAHSLHHHSRYEMLNFAEAKQLISHYFMPSHEVQERLDALTKSYEFDPERTLCICYRGTDKYTEVSPHPLEDYVIAAKSILRNEPKLRVLVQTDQAQVREQLVDQLGTNAFFFHELPVTHTSQVIHKVIQAERKEFGQTLLAVTLLMARCRHLITHTGNVAYWSALFRGHSDNLVQF
jgi:hypothetical protein